MQCGTKALPRSKGSEDGSPGSYAAALGATVPSQSENDRRDFSNSEGNAARRECCDERSRAAVSSILCIARV